ncbi:hypothetical protein EW145_g4889 [Phellinidium pouzarii]|uniref:Polyadenylation factor subunit 2 n=1 Tax=Phellinidium pouzarii TaxID=167371 RepID=A0A4S4L1Z3_9AGAM|nr:hypothetical protein EW145_g4889 [Phellinidium pouzarii]
MVDTLPVLLPSSCLPRVSSSGWRPSRHLETPQPPPADEHRQDIAMAAARQLLDGKALKKTRPRRTVDYGGSMGRSILNRKSRPNPSYVPYIRPAAPFIIDLLPPKAYPTNPSTSLTTKFVHTSTNKIRCPVNTVVWTPEGRRVLTGSTSGEFTLWNGLTFNFETILQAHDTAIRALTFTSSGAYLASADQTGIIKYFQPNMNNLTAWQAHREAVRGISFSPDDSRFATASDDSTVRIWDFEESREERVLSGHGWDVRCVQWHPTKGLLVSGSKDNLVKFWDPRTGTCLSTLCDCSFQYALSWSPNGDLVATASRDQTVRLFDIRAMKEFRVLKGHKKEVCSLAWHPVHPILVSGGSEGSILYWDVAEPDLSFNTTMSSSVSPPDGPRATLAEAHDSNVWAVAFHPLGHLLASASNDHTTRFWARERPGDAGSTFSGGGVRPPTGADDEGDEGEGEGEDEEMAVPGFAYVGAQQGVGQSQWWGKDEENLNGGGQTDSQFRRGGMNDGAGLGMALGDVSGFNMGMDDGIPGLGRVAPVEDPRAAGVAHRQNIPLPPQEDVYGDGDGAGGGQWGGNIQNYRERGHGPGRGAGASNGGGGRGSRWGPRRGGRY